MPPELWIILGIKNNDDHMGDMNVATGKYPVQAMVVKDVKYDVKSGLRRLVNSCVQYEEKKWRYRRSWCDIHQG